MCSNATSTLLGLSFPPETVPREFRAVSRGIFHGLTVRRSRSGSLCPLSPFHGEMWFIAFVTVRPMIQLFHTYVALSSLWRGGRVAVTEKQADLFGHPRTLPEGFRYRLEFLTEAEAQGLLQSI